MIGALYQTGSIIMRRQNSPRKYQRVGNHRMKGRWGVCIMWRTCDMSHARVVMRLFMMGRFKRFILIDRSDKWELNVDKCWLQFVKIKWTFLNSSTSTDSFEPSFICLLHSFLMSHELSLFHSIQLSFSHPSQQFLSHSSKLSTVINKISCSGQWGETWGTKNYDNSICNQCSRARICTVETCARGLIQLDWLVDCVFADWLVEWCTAKKVRNNNTHLHV